MIFSMYLTLSILYECNGRIDPDVDHQSLTLENVFTSF
jgi:hypothetical protein